MMGTRRTQRLGNLIQAELGDLLLKRVKDPRLALITITGVDVSPDLGQAKVFYSLLEAARRPEVETAFKSASPFLRRELASRLQIKVTPKLVPVYDPSLAEGVRLDGLIRQARQQDQALALARGDQPEPEGEDQP
ncbi:MAG: 30S ribosome-binding factor RbfA [Desulfarculus sp.]|nr:30S ribosome-binding factor RbfA [Desulfarculus sp.]